MTTQSPIQFAMVGLGRMGANLARRAMRDGHSVVVFDVNPDNVAALVAEGATGATSYADLVSKLEAPRTVWIMVPAGKITESVISEIGPLLSEGDVLIDGGNSSYQDDIAHANALRGRGVHFIDVGTSGGVFGLERGYCLMIGGDDPQVERLAPLWSTLAPGVGEIERTPGRSGDFAAEEQGWLHCGPNGAGHFVKMVHNGIEYGIMAAYAEGMNILAHAGAGLADREQDAETAPLAHPEHYQYNLDLPKVAEVWRRGSVVSSWLLDLTAAALQESPTLEEFGGRVSDSGEGRWTAIAAIESGAPAPVLTAALYSRFSSRGEATYGDKLLSAMRKQFGGHIEKNAE